MGISITAIGRDFLGRKHTLSKNETEMLDEAISKNQEGTIDNLKANAVNKNKNAKICNGLPSKYKGSSVKLMVPVAP